MLDIRALCLWDGPVSRNPRIIWKQYQRSRQAGALADWLHNLADYSEHDFQGFEEDWFWREYEGYRRRFPHGMDYRQAFDNKLERLEEGRGKRIRSNNQS